jgi:hypothetical protein
MEPRLARRVSRSAAALFTCTIGQQNFIDRDHNTVPKMEFTIAT